ncbi:MAG: rod shape-determining protein MreD [Pseudomonadota bacterium]|nr:rod shape-determining protein MreD [Pseudomonadota bacterium]
MSRLSAVLLLGAGVVASALPLGLPPDATFIPPLLMAALVFIFSSLPNPLTAWISFGVGLASDVLSAGPLGYWAFVFLLVHTIAVLYASQRGSRGFASYWGVFAASAVAVSLIGWLVACLYFVGAVDWRPMANGAIVAVLAFPVLVWPFREPLRLTRRAAAAGS